MTTVEEEEEQTMAVMVGMQVGGAAPGRLPLDEVVA